MIASVLRASESTVVTELPIPPIAYGLLTLAALLALLLVTFAFKSSGTRH
ncbi:hypothetical protein ACTVCO_10570 [Sanguibacter sp. A247]